MEKLVSILTPCYNGEKYIDRYVSALLKQSYHNCQLIFMDDGSTDGTREKILSYTEDLRKVGIILEYHYDKNKGLGAVIAEGIKYVKGNYVIWPDVDDIITKDSIRKKVDFLENNLDFGLVRTNFMKAKDTPENIYENDATKIYKYREKTYLFDDYLVSKNMWLQSGCYMIRMAAFDKANPDRYIYSTRTGQNWQMLLPVLFYYKCGYISDPLYIYVVRSDSMSNTLKTSFTKQKQQLFNYEELIVKTIEHMKLCDEKKFIDIVHTHYIKEQISLGFHYNNKEWVNENWSKLGKKDRNLKIRIKRMITVVPGMHMLARFLNNR